MSANFVSAVIKVIHASSVFLFLIVCLFTGCQTTDKETLVLSDAGIASANTHSNPPVLIYVPFYFGGGYTGRIALPSDKHKTTGQIHVVVRGEVVSPGPIRLPTGSTILQAIGAVGGFTAYPYTQEFTVTKNSGRKVVVYFHSHRLPDGNLSQVWCDMNEEVEGAKGSSRDAFQDMVSDCVLEEGDTIYVQRAS